ncbi:thyroxine 5-deiodinase-like [Lineus longissimus]|uniref:thyroxine 5-deiodinase-like n=1 Tax=Lineus longissimus TaxID=88925 RepID=UPI00315C6FBB
MRGLSTLTSISDDFSHIADFVLVYTEESHPTDKWTFSDRTYDISSHISIEDRVRATEHLTQLDFPFQMYIDSMENESLRAYAGSNGRIYIIKDNTVLFQGGVGPFYFKPAEIRQWFDRNIPMAADEDKEETVCDCKVGVSMTTTETEE